MFAALGVPPWLGTLARGPDRWMAGALLGAGLILVVWSRAALGASFTPFPKPVERGALVVSGPYRFVRHPIYSAVLLFLAGWAVLWQSLAGAFLTVVVLVVLDLKASREETLLENAYAGYAEYRRRTRKLIPYVY